MTIISWRGANGNWTKWHVEREEYPYSLHCRATVAERTSTIRKKLVSFEMKELCKECKANLILEMLKNARQQHNGTNREVSEVSGSAVRQPPDQDLAEKP